MTAHPATSRRLSLTLAALRILVGAYWLWEQHWKLPPGFGRDQPRGLMYAFQQGIEHPTLAVYKRFLKDVVVPHFTLFGWLLLTLEVSIGLSLVLGLFKRLGASLGTLQACNLLFAESGAPDGPWIYLAILVANALVLLTPSERAWSLDRYLAPRLQAAAGRRSAIARLLLWLTGGGARQRTEP